MKTVSILEAVFFISHIISHAEPFSGGGVLIPPFSLQANTNHFLKADSRDHNKKNKRSLSYWCTYW